MLIVFHYGNDDARCRHSRAVERMGEFKFSIFIFVSDIQSPCLEVVEIRRRAYFPVFVFIRHPKLYVVFLNLPEPKISSAINDRSVRDYSKTP